MEALEERRARIGHRKFARGFSMRPMLEGEQRVLPEWILYWDHPEGTGPPVRRGEEAWPITIWADTASTTGPTSDWTGIAILAVRPDVWADSDDIEDLSGCIKCIDAFHVKLPFPDRVRLFHRLVKKWRPKLVGIERAAGGIELAEELYDKYGITAVLPKPKGNKGSRLERITPYLAAGQVEFNPSLDPLEDIVTEERGDLIAELTGFPLTEHDDILDAFVYGVRWVTATRDCFVISERMLADEDGEELHGDEARMWLV